MISRTWPSFVSSSLSSLPCLLSSRAPKIRCGRSTFRSGEDLVAGALELPDDLAHLALFRQLQLVVTALLAQQPGAEDPLRKVDLPIWRGPCSWRPRAAR